MHGIQDVMELVLWLTDIMPRVSITLCGEGMSDKYIVYAMLNWWGIWGGEGLTKDCLEVLF